MENLMIIGGGAAGLAAAVTAARQARQQGAGDVRVMLYEADDRVGRSILATGNGRCNFSNAHVEAGRYRNADFAGAALRELAHQHQERVGKAAARTEDENPVHEFFSGLGLAWREESEGRLYPLANKASSVLDVLRAAADDFGVQVCCERRVVRVDAPGRPGGRFNVRFDDGAVEHPSAVVVAVGGRAAERLKLPGNVPCAAGRPVLGPLRTDERLVKPLNNIRVRCGVSLVAPDGVLRAHEQGELLFREYGVSGIAVFNLSRFAQPGDKLLIDLLPQVDSCDVESILLARRKRLAAGGRPLDGDAFLRGMLLSPVARTVLKAAGLRPDASFSKADAAVLGRALKGLELAVRGVGDARQCQVTRGGFSVDAFDARTMEARSVPGLFVTGEALDVDAPCGGFNLHWAWASGMLAGRAALGRLAERSERA